jgi:hypothetical protein
MKSANGDEASTQIIDKKLRIGPIAPTDTRVKANGKPSASISGTFIASRLNGCLKRIAKLLYAHSGTLPTTA